jgi:predicted NUDIX family NTP pyrophosphohydrolase
MPSTSAGLLLYRRRPTGPEVLILHMGGPFWRGKDEHAWSIPKGEYGAGEQARSAALREFAEETGLAPPPGEPVELGRFRQSSAKLLDVWTLEGELDLEGFESNTFELEWPRGSGRVSSFPEVDEAAWVGLEQARAKLVKGQAQLLDALTALLD